MSAPQKAQSPVGAGQCTDETKNIEILAVAEKLGNKPARQDCRLPAGCTAFPAEFLSKRAGAKHVELVRKGARIGATVDLIVGQFRRRPDYLVRLGNVSRRLNEVEAAGRWFDDIQRTGGAQ